MATNRIQIKRSTANSVVTGLNPGELAFTANGNVLFVGNPADGASVRIGGLQSPGTLTANQALVANATSGIDKVITANLVPTNIWANGAAGTAGQVLSSNSSGGVFWVAPSAGVAGSTTQIQFNDGGALAGDAGFVFDKTTDIVTANGGFQTPGTGTGAGGTVQNTSTMFVGNNTVNTVITSAGLNVNAATIANSSGVYTTGTVNAATVSVGSSIVANSSRLVIGTAVGVQANGGIGTAGQVLTSNGTTVFWAAASTADVTGVDAGNGLTGGGTTGDVALAVGQGNGITVSADAVAVNAGNGLVANATGLHILTTGDTTLIANATGLYVNDATLSIATSQLTGDVALGTQTSGNYVATIAAGAGISGSSSSEGGAATIAVVANSGIVANTTGVFVNPGNGLTVNATGVHITSRSFTLSGDVTGSATYDGTGTVTIATTIAADSVALGTDTTGNYVASITAGAGISGSSSSEGGAATIAVVANNGIVANTTGVFAKQANGITVDAGGINVLAGTGGGLVSNSTGVFVNANNGLVANATGLHVGSGNGISVSADALAVTGGSTLTVNTSGVHVNSTLSITDLSLSGNLTVLGTLSTIDTTNLTVKDSLIELANGNVSADLLDIGLYGQYSSTGTRYTGIFRDASDGVYKVFTNSTVEPTTTVDTGANGYVQGTLQSFFNSGAFVANATAVNITANSTVAVALVANTLTLTTALAGTSGGTGKTTMTNNAILVGNSSNGYNELTLNSNAGYVLQSNGTALVYDYLDGGTF
jgi:hypothetical protein